MACWSVGDSEPGRSFFIRQTLILVMNDPALPAFVRLPEITQSLWTNEIM